MRYRFFDFTLDVEARVLRHGERVAHLSRKAFDLLSLLVRERHRVVGRTELQDAQWPDTFVVDGNLPVLVREIRTAIGDHKKEFIATVHRTGYRFSAPVRAVPVLETIDSVAVMPLVNRSGDPSLDYLVEGIVDHIINRLALVPGLRVMSRRAVFSYRGEGNDPRRIGRDMNVAAVMNGSLSRGDGQTSITIELVASAGAHLLMSRTYVRADAELVSLPLRIAADLAEHLQAEIDPAVRAGILKEPTASPDAYRHYLRARQCLNHFDPASLHQPIQWNTRAVAADPNFAAAYSDLSRAFLQLAVYFESPRELMPQALRNARRALAIDGTLADAYVNLGVIHFIYDWDFDAAERELFITSELHPATAEAFSCASHVLESSGRPVNAEEFIRRGLVADPRSVPLLTELGCNSYAHRRYDTAIAEFRAALELDPRSPVARWGIGRSLAQKAMYAESLDELRRVEEMNGFAPPIVLSEIGYVLGRSGSIEQARAIAEALEGERSGTYIDAYLVAIIYLGMGETTKHFGGSTSRFRKGRRSRSPPPVSRSGITCEAT